MKFIPADITTEPLPNLLRKAEISEQNISEAVEDWKKDPPDELFIDILEAEIDD